MAYEWSFFQNFANISYQFCSFVRAEANSSRFSCFLFSLHDDSFILRTWSPAGEASIRLGDDVSKQDAFKSPSSMRLAEEWCVLRRVRKFSYWEKNTASDDVIMKLCLKVKDHKMYFHVLNFLPPCHYWMTLVKRANTCYQCLLAMNGPSLFLLFCFILCFLFDMIRL